LASKSTVKIASQLLDRFFRDAEGRTNRQIDVYFAVEDMDLGSDKAGPALEYLKSRGLVNLFGSDIGFLTEKGIQAIVEDLDLGAMQKEARDFVQRPIASSTPAAAPASAPAPAAKAAPQSSPRPERAQLTHIDLEGGEFTLKLEHRCRIGRADDNEVRINDKRASKHHAELVYDQGRYLLVDLESANGTLLNGDYALEPTPLKHDDEVVIGRTMLLYQAPQVIPAPAPEAPKAPDEPKTVAATSPPVATERPARADSVEVDPAPSIRVIKGVPSAPPSADHRAPSSADHRAPIPAPSTSGADLFAEPPTQAPAADLFATPTAAPSVTPSDDLFGDDAPTQMPPGPSGSPAPGDGLFEADPGAIKNEDLFADDGPTGTSGAHQEDDLFSDGPATAQGQGLFEDSPAHAEVPRPDPSGGLGLEPIAARPSEPLHVPDTVASEGPVGTPAPDVNDLWEGDVTPTSDQGGQLENAPVHFDASTSDTIDTPAGRDDASTLMMDRETMLADAEVVAEELPHWSQSADPAESSPPFAQPADILDAATEAISAEDLPEASPSLAMPAIDTASAQTMDAEPANPEFYRLLSALKAHARETNIPDQDALVEAIERLESNPYVRQALKSL